jgi:hypothetical protein
MMARRRAAALPVWVGFIILGLRLRLAPIPAVATNLAVPACK